ncbi:integrase [Paenibacillus jamilae]|uniref:Integrase n=2 Tax=Paenibacillus TaxID=44249 RepID=E3ECD9_PAEPS|nr:integrase [Paenibacillus polymyxa SC2]KTS82581.1 integrase [Paenibacillus jamilae]CCC83213.1 putative transposase insK for insertion sequence element IS150 [Paenibacillus polymyxa M1]
MGNSVGYPDLFNNGIVAWRLSQRNDLALVNETLDALSKDVNIEGVILHSDQGFQYTSKPFNRKLKSSESLEAIPGEETV